MRVPAVRLDADRLAGMSRLLRVLYAPKNRLAASPEDLAATYVRVTEDGGEGAVRGIYVDERGRPVNVPAFARDPAARERLWAVTQAAAGNPSWAW